MSDSQAVGRGRRWPGPSDGGQEQGSISGHQRLEVEQWRVDGF
jgi:hypothetical protein